ncbi:MAG: ribbon-helix-helix protein, CopG family [bacterium]
MSTISVPLSTELAQTLDKAVQESGSTKADIMRQALKFYAEECAVRKILFAASEPSLAGNLDELVASID